MWIVRCSSKGAGESLHLINAACAWCLFGTRRVNDRVRQRTSLNSSIDRMIASITFTVVVVVLVLAFALWVVVVVLPLLFRTRGLVGM